MIEYDYEADKLDFISLFRRDKEVALCNCLLDWVSPPIMRIEDLPYGGFYVKAGYFEGDKKLIIRDIYTNQNLKLHEIIDILNGYELPIYGLKNELLSEKVPLYNEVETYQGSEQYETETQTISDLIEDLIYNKRLVNESRFKLENDSLKSALRIGVRAFKKDLITTKHHYTIDNRLYRSKKLPIITIEQARKAIREGWMNPPKQNIYLKGA